MTITDIREHKMKPTKKKPTKKDEGLTAKTFVAMARPIVDRIGKERDALRNLVEEYREILQSIDEGHEELDRALDTISQYI